MSASFFSFCSAPLARRFLYYVKSASSTFIGGVSVLSSVFSGVCFFCCLRLPLFDLIEHKVASHLFTRHLAQVIVDTLRLRVLAKLQNIDHLHFHTTAFRVVTTKMCVKSFATSPYTLASLSAALPLIDSTTENSSTESRRSLPWLKYIYKKITNVL